LEFFAWSNIFIRKKESVWDEEKNMRLSKKRLTLNVNGDENGIIEIKNGSINKECKNTIRIWKRNCPECGTEIVYYHSSNFYYARSQHRLCSHCCIKGKKSSFYGGKQWTPERRKWWSKNAPNLFTSKNNPTNDPIVRRKISEWAKTRVISSETKKKLSVAKSGKNNPRYGKCPPKSSGSGWHCWYKGFYFRSCRELMYYIQSENNGVKCECVEHKISIPYKTTNEKERTYHPDFLVDDKMLIEIKPGKLWNTKEVAAKKQAAECFCKMMGYEYKLVDIEPNSLLLKEKYLNGEIRFVEKYKSRFEKYIGV